MSAAPSVGLGAGTSTPSATSRSATRGATVGPAGRPPVRRVLPERPRLLLPPVAEPRGSVPAADPAAAAAVRSILAPVVSPVTAAPWPGQVPEQVPEEAPPPDPTRLCGAVVVAAIEALRCLRPLAQLARWVTPAVFDSLAAAVTPGPVGPGRRAVVRSVHLCRLRSDVAEATVVVHDGARVRASAVRLEVHRGSWRATVLQIG